MGVKIVRIPKGNGKFRTIYVLSREMRHVLRQLVPVLEEQALKLCPPGVVHGFWPGRSAVSNAQKHVGYEYTLSFDLADFFDTCNGDKLTGKLKTKYFNSILFSGALRQGPPTSPPAANICFSHADHEIVNLAGSVGAVYTRYADDLTFSANNLDAIKAIQERVPEIIAKEGFTLNESKTRLQWARAGRRVICGVAVDAEGVHPTRKSKRKLRAARHRLAKARTEIQYMHAWRRVAGLMQWVMCKPPGLGRKARHAMLGNSAQDQLRIALDVARFQ